MRSKSIDAAKHMCPNDLLAIYQRKKKLSPTNGYPQNALTYIYQEVIDFDGEAVIKFEYNKVAEVIEFQYGIIFGSMFRGLDNLKRLQTFDKEEDWRMLSSDNVLVMIDNHDNQRGHGAGGATILTHKDPKPWQ